jgi:hypothetical protein
VTQSPFVSIRRIPGGVVAQEVLPEDQIMFTAALSAPPPVEWTEFFQSGPYDQHPEDCDPASIRVDGDRLVFESKESAAVRSVETIDKFISVTNTRYEEHLQNKTREAEARRARLQRATDLVKNL